MPDDATMEILRTIQADLADLKSKFAALPDLHFLQAAAVRQLREATEARDFRRSAEIKLNEIYGSMATSSEIDKLRTEVAQTLDRERELDLRVATIESHLGLSNPLQGQ